MQKAKPNVGVMEARLKELGSKLDEFVKKAEAAGADAKLEVREQMDDLAGKQRSALAKLEELRADGSDKWETLKAGVEGACNELETAFRKLTTG